MEILQNLKSRKGESMWSIRFPNLQKLSNQFPYVGKIPKQASDIIVDRMNLKGHTNDWQAFASQYWPTYTVDDIKINFKDKMQSVLNRLGSKGETTGKLLDLLEKLKRRDVLDNLEEYCR